VLFLAVSTVTREERVYFRVWLPAGTPQIRVSEPEPCNVPRQIAGSRMEQNHMECFSCFKVMLLSILGFVHE
jgi:hypothetical protein